VMGGASMLGAIAFDPTIRGILIVVVAMVSLVGSIYMILATNTGARVAFLITSSGFFGWMVIMTIVWVIYGIGLVGRAPAWMPTDINLDRATPVPEVQQFADLPPTDKQEDPAEVLADFPLLQSLARGNEGKAYAPTSMTKLKTVIQPWVIASAESVAEVAAKAEATVPEDIAADPELAALYAAGGEKLSKEVNAQALELRDRIEKPLNGWCLLTESDPRRGEAVASADAALIAEKIFGDTTEPADYIVKDVYFFGGKAQCEPVDELPTATRAFNRVKSVFQVLNPKLYSAVTLVKVKDVVVEPGGTPPSATADPKAGEVTVVMLRNLGNKRFIPFTLFMISLMGFIIFTSILHYRDKQAMAIRDAFGGAGKGK
jgi:hypothetical protein